MNKFIVYTMYHGPYPMMADTADHARQIAKERIQLRYPGERVIITTVFQEN